MLKHDYVTYKLIPDVSIKNANNDMLAQIMATCYQTPLQRLNKKGMNEVTKFYFDVELWVVYIFWILSPVGHIICKCFLSFSELSFHFVDGFPCCEKAVTLSHLFSFALFLLP